jgi:hypothetical protein
MIFVESILVFVPTFLAVIYGSDGDGDPIDTGIDGANLSGCSLGGFDE